MFTFLFSRVSFVIVFACAAVVSFIIDSHGAKAFPSVAPIDSGVEPVLRSYKHFSLLSSEPGNQPGNVPETPKNWKALNNRNAPAIIYVQSNAPRKGLVSYNPNSQHNQPHFERMTQVHKGQNLGGVKPASSTRSDLSRVNPNSFFQSQTDGSNNGNSQSWLAPFFWKLPQEERALPQSPSQVQKAYDYQIPRSGPSAFLESRSENRFDWQSPNLPRSPVPFRRSGYWSLQSKNSKRDDEDSKGGHAGTSGIQSNKPPSFLHHRSSLLSPTSTSLDSSEIKPEKTISSITAKSSQSEISPNSNVKTSYKRVQSYLLRNIHTTIAPMGVKTQNSLYNLHSGQDFNQQIKANSMLLHRENQFGGHVGDVMKYDPASVIYRAPKMETLTSYEDPNGAKQNAKEAKSSLADTGRPQNPFENVQPKSSNPSSGLAGWPVLKKNSLSTINSKEANSEARTYRFMRPSMLQKYSFGQRLAGPEKTSRHFGSSEFLDATTSKSSSLQDYGSANKIKAEDNLKSGAVSSLELDEQKRDGKPRTKSADILKLVTLTRIKSQSKTGKHETTTSPFNRRYKQGKAKDLEFKAVTYDDIIGSASFSSVMPEKTITHSDHFEKPETSAKQNKSMDLSDVDVDGKASTTNKNASVGLSVGGERADFKGEAEAETETGISDLRGSKEENEAKNVPQELPSDPEETIESDSLLELEYLRTSTGNVSFQSLNLNL
ncbi:uncharacterized protein LOC129409850 [Boleophthalmus pectinirostris]|uniref:uncharacterized protein LOC129409850 n=1 Tax=Boleophthalmus pectinirostris TaxID=150288 RepID=UPI0024323BEE|nr:uncharacterized protein LOC129409850 [Boleophthalmus pectinirostris]